MKRYVFKKLGMLGEMYDEQGDEALLPIGTRFILAGDYALLEARCEAAEKDLTALSRLRDEYAAGNAALRLELSYHPERCTLEHFDHHAELRSLCDRVQTDLDALRAKLEIVVGALKQIQCGDDTAPETMRWAAKDAISAIGAL